MLLLILMKQQHFIIFQFEAQNAHCIIDGFAKMPLQAFLLHGIMPVWRRMTMELRVLNYFLMVAREENITKAAQLLHVTQPTLSRQLKHERAVEYDLRLSPPSSIYNI